MYLGLFNLGLNRIQPVAGGGLELTDFTTNGISVGSLLQASIPTAAELEIILDAAPLSDVVWHWFAYDPMTQSPIDGADRGTGSTYTLQVADIGLAVAGVIIYLDNGAPANLSCNASTLCEPFWYDPMFPSYGIGLVTA